MRRVHIVVGTLGLVMGGAIGVVAGCGSDDPAAIAAPPDGAASSSSSTSSSGGDPGTSTSSSTSSSSGSDPGDSGTTSSGNVASNAFRISCGPLECDAGGGGGGGGGLCCVRDGGTDPVCLRANQANQCDNAQGENTLQLNCDETADCPKTNIQGNDVQQKCCLTRQGDIGASCGFTCGGGGGQPARPLLCKTNAECSDGGANQATCGEKTCRGFKVRVCGTPDGCN